MRAAFSMRESPKASSGSGRCRRLAMRTWTSVTTTGGRRALLQGLVVALLAVTCLVTVAMHGGTPRGWALQRRGQGADGGGPSVGSKRPTIAAGHFLDGPVTVVPPHGMPAVDGAPPPLVNLMVSPARRAELLAEAGGMRSLTLSSRHVCDLELLLNGGFSPLLGFMDRPTYEGVLADMRLGPGRGLGSGGEAPEPYLAPGVTYETLPSSGLLWPMPITLDVSREAVAGLTTVDGRTLPAEEGGQRSPPRTTPPKGKGAAFVEGPSGSRVPASSRLLLRDAYANPLAVLTVTDLYVPDLRAEARAVFGTEDGSHPGVAYLLNEAAPVYVGGILEGLSLPPHYDFGPLRRTPREVRAELLRRGWARTVAFQTRNPMHRAHIELTRLAGESAAAGVLLQPVVGMTKPGDVDASVRVRCYEAVVSSGRYYPAGGVLLSLLPLAMRMGGPREALWHAIIRKNHGATHFIVGRDHAGVKSGLTGRDFYGPYDAQMLVLSHAAELGVAIIPFQEVEYLPRLDAYLPLDRIALGEKTLSLSGTKVRAMMARGDDIPPWFSDPDVIAILRAVQPPTRQRGFVVFFTGLSGGGKTTLSHALMQRLAALVPTRRITVLDGDVVRTHLSKGLGFSITDRVANVERIGFVAAEAARHGGIVLAAPIAPFDASRRSARRMAADAGAGFVLVHVRTSVGTCAARDVKGLYGAAGYGRLEPATHTFALSAVANDLTGISHPYEHPPALPEEGVWGGALAAALAAGTGANAPAPRPDGPIEAGSLAGVDVEVDTEGADVGDGASAIIARLVQLGYIDEPLPSEGEHDDDGSGKVGSRLTPLEGRLASSLRSLTSSSDGGVLSSRELVALFPTAVGEALGPRAAADLLSGSDQSSGPLRVSLPPTCEVDWDDLLVPASSSSGQPLSRAEAASLKRDLVTGTGGTSRVRMHAGWPSRGSPAATGLAGGSGGASIALGAAPSQIVLLLLAPGLADARASAGDAASALRAGAQQSATRVGVLPPSRVLAALQWGATSEGGGKGEAGAAVPGPAFVPLAPGADAGTALTATLGSAPVLSEAGRVAAAYDLWTALRWATAGQVEAGAGRGIAGVVVPPAAYSAVLDLLPVLTRLDTCLQAVAVVPGEGAEGLLGQGGRVTVVGEARLR